MPDEDEEDEEDDYIGEQEILEEPSIMPLFSEIESFENTANEPIFSYDVQIINEWQGYYNGEITLKNIGKTKIENWIINVKSNDKIVNIWNAQIIETDNDAYTIKNNGWNA